jgi:hypothetical protein
VQRIRHVVKPGRARPVKLAAAPRPRPKGFVASSWSQRTVLVDLPTPVDCDTHPTYAMSLLPGMMKPPPQDLLDEVAGPDQLTAAPAVEEGRTPLPDFGENPGLLDEVFPGVVSPGGGTPGGVSPGGVSPGGVSPGGGQPPVLPPEGGQPPFVGPDLTPPVIGPPLLPIDELPTVPGAPPVILPPGDQPPLVPVDALPPGVPPGGPPPVTAIPEPATWLAMILGFVGIGAALRSRRRAKAAQAL